MSSDVDATPTEVVSPSIVSLAKAEIAGIVRRLLHPNSLAFNLTVTAVAGAVTTVFAVIILLMIMVATNFNLLGAIE